MQTLRHHSGLRLALLAVIAVLLVGMLIFDVVEPTTPFEQQALIGSILVLGVPALWLL